MGDAAGLLASELRCLYQAAGAPTLSTLVRQGRAQRPAVKLSDATVSDWLGGNAVPSMPAALRFLVVYLENAAAKRGTYRPRGADWWLGLRQRAWQQKHANRGGRPRGNARRQANVRHVNQAAGSRHAAEDAALVQARYFAEHDIYHSVVPLRCSTSMEDLKNPTTTEHAWLTQSVRDAVDAGVGLIFVLGEVGSGKTWFLKQLYMSKIAEYSAGSTTYRNTWISANACGRSARPAGHGNGTSCWGPTINRYGACCC